MMTYVTQNLLIKYAFWSQQPGNKRDPCIRNRKSRQIYRSQPGAWVESPVYLSFGILELLGTKMR